MATFQSQKLQLPAVKHTKRCDWLKKKTFLLYTFEGVRVNRESGDVSTGYLAEAFKLQYIFELIIL
jgi:hypothetical protein